MDKRTKLIAIAVAVLFVLLIGIFNAPSIVVIESEPGATISLATEKDGSFKKIGTTKASHLSFSKPGDLYISAELDGKQTISHVKQKRLSRQTVRLDLAATVSAQKVTDGALVDAIFNETKGQGIVPGQNTLINFSTTRADEPINPAFAGLPYVEKVIWYDYNNAVYLTDEGIGQYVGGSDKGFASVGTRIVGDVKIEPGSTNDQGGPIIKDMAKSGDKPLVLLSNTSIFTSATMGTRLNAISTFETAKSDISIFASDNSIFKVTAPRLSESEEDGEIAQEQGIVIDELSYTGEEVRTSTLDDTQEVIDIVKSNGATYVLTFAGLHTIKGDDVQKQESYFANPAGMIVYKGDVVVLANDGLWKVSRDGKSFQRLFKFTDYGVGLEGSMSVDPNDQIIFGTRPKDGGRDNSATFVTSF